MPSAPLRQAKGCLAAMDEAPQGVVVALCHDRLITGLLRPALHLGYLPAKILHVRLLLQQLT
eukprot:14774057-Alexandrium_andersonii.AAC.1